MPPKSRPNPDAPRPNRIAINLSDEVLRRLDAWRTSPRRKRADAAAILLESALDAAAKAAS